MRAALFLLLAPLEMPWWFRIVGCPNAPSIPPCILLSGSVLVFTFERVLLELPSPTVHKHF